MLRKKRIMSFRSSECGVLLLRCALCSVLGKYVFVGIVSSQSYLLILWVLFFTLGKVVFILLGLIFYRFFDYGKVIIYLVFLSFAFI